jgi:methionyl-tRNA formyltransferase
MQPTFVFFGSSSFSIHVLDALASAHILPVAVVTLPDKPQGRGLGLEPNPVKTWATIRNINIIEAIKLKDGTLAEQLKKIGADVFVVASFGKIIPADIIYMPRAKTLNVHPSLLPRLRGPAPIQYAILEENRTGVTIMRLDEKMDEGPIVAQKEVPFSVWPLPYSQAEAILGRVGGDLLAAILPQWVNGEIKEVPQDHSLATYTEMLEKIHGDITTDVPEKALRKIHAFEIWPKTYLWCDRADGTKERIIVRKAHLEEGRLCLDKIIPEGKREMSWEEYLRGKH